MKSQKIVRLQVNQFPLFIINTFPCSLTIVISLLLSLELVKFLNIFIEILQKFSEIQTDLFILFYSLSKSIIYQHSIQKISNIYNNYHLEIEISPMLCVLVYIFVLIQSRKPYGTLKELTLTTTYKTSVVTGDGRRYILDEQFLYVGTTVGIIQKRDFFGTLLGTFQDPIVVGQSVIFLELYKEKLISIYLSGLITVWNINTLIMLNHTTIPYTPKRMHYYIKEKDRLIIAVHQNMGFLQFDIQKMQITCVISNASKPNASHLFAISPNGRTIIDWWLNSTSVKIYNVSSNSLSLLQQYFQNISGGPGENMALFSSDNSQIIFTYKAGLRFHYIKNSFAPSKQMQLLTNNSDLANCVIFFNQIERTFLVSSNNQTVIYDELNNESVKFYNLNHRTSFLNKNRRYLLQFANTMIRVLKIACKADYFYDNETGFCYPCWVNNCSQCDNQTGKCLNCINETYYVNQQGICFKCGNYCLSCQDKTGACKECQSPYQLNSKFQCDLQSNTVAKTLQIGTSALSSTKIYGSSLIMSFINQLQLYNYHNRDYGNKTLLYLKPANIFQVSKLSLLSQQNSNKMFWSMRASSSYKNFIKNQQFHSQTGLDYGFWNASFLFFIQLVPLGFVLYVLLRLVFRLLFNYRISKYVRQYSFYLFIMPCLFGNHVEYLSYTAANQLQSMMYLTIWDKLLLMLFLLFLFVFLIYLVAFPFLVLIFHKKTKNYFFDESLPNLAGSFAINIFTTYKGFILSVIQSFMFQTYIQQMCLMIGVQLLVIFLLLVIEKKWKCFDKKSSFVCILVHQLLMVLLNIVLIIDYQYRQINDSQTTVATDGAVESIIWFIGLNIIINTIMALNPMKNQKKQQQEKSQTQKQSTSITNKRSSTKSIKPEKTVLSSKKKSNDAQRQVLKVQSMKKVEPIKEGQKTNQKINKEIYVKQNPSENNSGSQVKNMQQDSHLKNLKVNSQKKKIKEKNVKNLPSKNNLIIMKLMKQEDIMIEQQ